MTDLVERRWIGVERMGPSCLTRLERVAEIWRDQGMTVTEWVPLAALEAAQAQAAEVRRETIAECAKHLTTLADAMHEKAEAIADRSSRQGSFVRPLTSERDAAVMAYDFEQAATAIRALTDAAEKSDHFPDVGKMVRRKANHAHTYELAGRSTTHVHLRFMTRIVLPLETFEADYEIAPDSAR